MSSCGFFQAIDHLPIPDQFNAVEWQAASGQNFNLDCPTASWQTESGTHGLALNLKPQERTTTDEGIACSVALDVLVDDAGFVRSGPNYLLIGAEA